MSKVNGRRAGGCLAVAVFLFLPAAFGGDWGRGGRVQPAGGVQRDARIDSVPLLTIGDGPDRPLHRVVGAALVGDTLIIAQSSSLGFHDRRSGRLLRRAGRRGEGPGEHRAIASLDRVGERLYTYDSFARRVTVWDLAGALERTVDIRYWAPYGSPELVGVFPDGSFLFAAESRDHDQPARSPMLRRNAMVLGRYDANGVLADSLGHYLGVELFVTPLEGGGQGHGGPPPFARRGSAGVIGQGYYILDNTEAAIPVFDMGGTLLREIGPDPPPEPVRLSRRDRDRLREYGDLLADSHPDADDMDSDEFPRFYPFYSRDAAVLGDAFWVPGFVDPAGDPRRDWTVHALQGQRLGRVRTDERLTILAVDGDVAVVVHYGGWDVETVQLRRIVEDG